MKIFGVIKMKSHIFIQAAVCVAMMVLSANSAPVPVTDVITSPGFSDGIPAGSGRVLDYIEISNVWYNVRGVVCTECNEGTISYAVDEPVPTLRTNMLSGLKYTQTVLNIGASGAKFDLGVTVTDDSVRILFSEIAPPHVYTGDPISIYPTTNGVVVGSWKLDIVSGDYADTGYEWQNNYAGYLFRSFITSFCLSDFSGDTGPLTFDGIKIADNNGIDPNLIAIVEDPVDIPVSTTEPVPATGIFSPGFVLSPETNLQTLVGIATSNGTFQSVSSLTCVSASGGDVYQTDTNSPISKQEALSALSFTEVVANCAEYEFGIGQTVNSDDNIRFFLSECEVDANGTMDKIIVYPLFDSNLIQTWCLEFKSSDFGTPSPGWKATRANDGHTPTFYGSLTSFSLSDFTNGPPVSLTGVNGFKVVCPNVEISSNVFVRADMSILGMYEVPPPPPSGTVIMIN